MIAQTTAIQQEPTKSSCKHKFVLLETRMRKDTSGYGSYYRMDEFYCMRCLVLHAIQRVFHEKAGIKEGAPEWYTL